MRAAAFVLALMGTLAAADAAEFRIGVSAPLTGPDVVFGDQIRLGVERAVGDANAAGGFLGQRGRVVGRDDGNDPKRAADVAGSFAAEKVAVVIGCLSSAATVAASSVYADAGVLEVTPSALAPIVTDRGLGSLFRTGGRDDGQAETAVRFLRSRHLTRIAIVQDRTGAGRELADAVRAELGKAGLREVAYGSLDKASRDPSALIDRIRASGAQAAFFGGTGADAGLLVHQLHDALPRLLVVAGSGIAGDEFSAAAGAAAEGTLMVFPEDPKARPAAADLLRRLRADGVEPDALFYYAYAAVQVIRQAADATRSLDPKQLAAAMHDGRTFKTVLGDLSFDAKGDPTTPDYVVYVWHRGATGRMTFDERAKS